ncbi:CBO0543 family protein [Alkalihalobacillus deserti]|uniref:CBO0543 family protein n=1 Tax=Alkalihalobacillus deserti TaxID=2879466 RepID=UPI001D14E1D5|nr:CBO0543 family protein [Alkalihalobacillus deserti]
MLTTISPYMPLTLSILLPIVAWLFGDWRNWKKYYPTILFLSVASLIVFLLTHNYPLWKFHSSFLFPNRTLQELRLALFILPSICLLFLTFYKYKSRIIQLFFYITFWVVLLSVIETLLVKASILTYHNGWNIWWTVLFWYVSLPVIRLHHTNPFWAWLSVLVLTILSIVYFEIPISKLA